MAGKAEAVSARDRAARLVHPVLVLLVVAVLAYGLLLPQMGFFWDELPMSWIRYELGPEAMTRYFSTNRPVWGMLYQLTTRVLPQVPIYWEVLALVLRWASAVLVWLMARNLWRGQSRIRADRGPGVPAVSRLQPAVDLLSVQPLLHCAVLLAAFSPVFDLGESDPERRVPLTAGGMLLSA